MTESVLDITSSPKFKLLELCLLILNGTRDSYALLIYKEA